MTTFHCSFAQTTDTISLKGIEVTAQPYEKYRVGRRVSLVDSADLARNGSQNLAEILSRNSPAYFRTYGHGMLSTSSVRGLSASHTALLWHGANINLPTLGQSDFSLVPAGLFDDIELELGSNSALFGSDAMGGAVQLKDQFLPKDGIQLRTDLEAGSFGFMSLLQKVQFRSDQWSGNTAVFYQTAENDFSYTNPFFAGRPEMQMQNAAFASIGLKQDLNYQINQKNQLSFNVWLQDMDRQVQPTMARPQGDDHQADRNFRLRLAWNREAERTSWTSQNFFFRDEMNFNGAISQVNRFQHQTENELFLSENLSIRSGLLAQYFEAFNNNLGANGVNEWRIEVFNSILYQPIDRLLLSINLRQGHVEGFPMPFTPSLGWEYTVSEHDDHTITWLGSGGRSYRVPTLNDRFWSPGGDPNLRPEDAWSVETGFRLEKKFSNHLWSTEVTAYHKWVSNWIAWVPGPTFWSPQNIHEVEALGLELGGNYSYQIKERQQIRVGLQYAYTQSNRIRASGLAPTQLMYVPFHSGILFSEWGFNGASIRAEVNHTGMRYTTMDNSLNLEAFNLFNLFIGYPLEVGKNTLRPQIRVMNVLNTDFQNYANRAMPGRHFQFGLQWMPRW
ncbi:MAG: TonB-dependent receptor [Cyclobacteriaceae bacterium]|nr:TonB-dependent receptor [Cyclobacteriaceae bacterium]MCH8516858.1 TonB-dependent receptor [Cyclobacteriaceae bacterium]